jgi:hypothetical protein
MNVIFRIRQTLGSQVALRGPMLPAFWSKDRDPISISSLPESPSYVMKAFCALRDLSKNGEAKTLVSGQGRP